MDFATLVLLVLISVKAIGILNAIRWLSRNGTEFSETLRRRSDPLSEDEWYEALEQNHGRFFPFGVRDYRLRRYMGIQMGRRLQQRLLATILRLWFQMLWRFQRLNLLAGIYVVLTISLLPVPVFVLSEGAHRRLLYVLAVGLLATNVLLSIETIFSYANLGGYATSFHRLSPQPDKSGRGSTLTLELKVIVGRAAATVWSGAVAAYVAKVGFQSLGGPNLVDFQRSDVMSWVTLLWQCFYFANTTFVTVGYGDIYPTSVYGQIVSFVIELQSFAVLGIVFASLFASQGANSPGQKKD